MTFGWNKWSVSGAIVAGLVSSGLAVQFAVERTFGSLAPATQLFVETVVLTAALAILVVRVVIAPRERLHVVSESDQRPSLAHVATPLAAATVAVGKRHLALVPSLSND